MKIYYDTLKRTEYTSAVTKPSKKIKERCCWSVMNNSISNYIKSCIRCNQNNAIRRKADDHLKAVEPPSGV